MKACFQIGDVVVEQSRHIYFFRISSELLDIIDDGCVSDSVKLNHVLGTSLELKGAGAFSKGCLGGGGGCLDGNCTIGKDIKRLRYGQ